MFRRATSRVTSVSRWRSVEGSPTVAKEGLLHREGRTHDDSLLRRL
jgi:hypothetical protein